MFDFPFSLFFFIPVRHASMGRVIVIIAFDSSAFEFGV